MSDVIIDLETFGTAIDSAFISIGAVRINIETGKELDRFYVNIDFKDAKNYGTVSKSTVDWWMTQDKKTRALLKIDPQPLEKAMYDFSCWIKSNDKVWGNGALFDIGILEHYYNKVRTSMPWKFWNIRDVRTMVMIGKSIFNYKGDEIPFVGKQHYAMDDAIHEAKVISYIYRLILEANNAQTNN